MTPHDPTAPVLLGGRWRLAALIAEGGTALVYEATSAAGERAAVKVLRPELADSAELRARFIREARVGDLIGHKGAVKVLDEGQCEGGAPFLALELLEGETVEARWERKGGRLPVREVLWIADQTLDVLAAAHKKGVVHRDIKPENIFITHDRRLKVLDFGIAGLGETPADSETTRVGTVMGTPAFMPPEQARGDWASVGVQTDLWSVGATMYTLLSGHLVHEEQKLFDQLRAAINTPALSLARVAPEVPSPVVDLVDFALSFQVAGRWPSARAMQSAVRVAYAEHRRLAEGLLAPENIEDAFEVTDRVLIYERPEAPPMSLRRPR